MLDLEQAATQALLREALADPNLVQSFSGVRTHFGETGEISPQHAALAAVYGYCYARTLTDGQAPLILARDPRPTGRPLCEALVRGFLAGGLTSLMDLGIITTPLAQSAVRSFNAAGGVIVTASHNPLGDNGWKFLTGKGAGGNSAAPEGALLAAEHMAGIVADVSRAAADGSSTPAALMSVSAADAFSALVTSGSRRMHNRAAEAYTSTIVNDWGLDIDDVRRRGLGPIVLDPNGGAASGLTSGVLEDIGVRVYEVNAELSRPAHPIDTDAVDKSTGEHVLTRVARTVSRCGAHFGVAFDYDADRGNVVLPGDSSSAVVHPQSIAALNVALALARWQLMGRGGNCRVVASESTSRRVEAIANLFGAEVSWVETGEVNVVTRIRELASQGAEVPVGVEGANGGTVFAGSTCRDGVLTALSCALAVAGEDAARLWLKLSPRGDGAHAGGLAGLIGALPEWHSPMEKITVNPVPHSAVKKVLEDSFRRDVWPRISSRYSDFSFADYEGTGPVSERTAEETGGWRIELERPGAKPYIFARGSRTEADIWRISADSPDAAEAEELLEIIRVLMKRF